MTTRQVCFVVAIVIIALLVLCFIVPALRGAELTGKMPPPPPWRINCQELSEMVPTFALATKCVYRRRVVEQPGSKWLAGPSRVFVEGAIAIPPGEAVVLAEGGARTDSATRIIRELGLPAGWIGNENMRWLASRKLNDKLQDDSAFRPQYVFIDKESGIIVFVMTIN